MANTKTLVDTIAASFDSFSNFKAAEAGQVRQIRCDFDTINTDLLVFAPGTDAYWTILGWQHCDDQAHIVRVYSADVGVSDALSNQVLHVEYNLNAGNGLSKELSGTPLIVGKKGKGLVLQVSAQPISILLYVAEFKSFRF